MEDRPVELISLFSQDVEYSRRFENIEWKRAVSGQLMRGTGLHSYLGLGRGGCRVTVTLVKPGQGRSLAQSMGSPHPSPTPPGSWLEMKNLRPTVVLWSQTLPLKIRLFM